MGGTNRKWSPMVAAVVAVLIAAEQARAAEGRSAWGGAPGVSPARRIVVSLPDRKLALIEGHAVVTIFPVAVGAPVSPSPIGTFTIEKRLASPTYYGPGKVIAPGPSNPLGTRWLGLSVKGYGIHGTDQPRSIGHARSHGCIRLRNRDVEALFDLVRAGDVVEILSEPSVELARIFRPVAQ